MFHEVFANGLLFVLKKQSVCHLLLLFSQEFPSRGSLAHRILCVAVRSAVTYITFFERNCGGAVFSGVIALKWCNPHHRIEICGVTAGNRPAFHKVINTCVENFTEKKSSRLHFGITRA